MSRSDSSAEASAVGAMRNDGEPPNLQGVQLNEMKHFFCGMFEDMRCRLLADFKVALRESLTQVNKLEGNADVPPSLLGKLPEPLTCVARTLDAVPLAVTAFPDGTNDGRALPETEQHFKIVSGDSNGTTERTSPEEIEQLFKIIDGNGNGILERVEFIKAFRSNRDVTIFCRKNKCLARLLNPRTFKAAFDSIDVDHSDGISLPEFRAALETVIGHNGKYDNIAQLFDMFGKHEGLAQEVSSHDLFKALHTNAAILSFCRQHAELLPLLDPAEFRRAFTKVKNREATRITLQDFREVIRSMSSSNGNLDDLSNEQLQVRVPTRAQLSAFTGDLQTSALDLEVYDVVNFYSKAGIWQTLARSSAFLNITLGVIVVNAVYLGVDTEHNSAETLLEAHWSFIMFEYLFCVFFSFEIIVRFGAFEHKCDCLKDGWFKFDAILVFLMVTEACVMPFVLPSGTSPPPTGPLRLLRLLRLSRLIRLMRFLPELILIMKGIIVGCRAVSSSLLMVAILVYVCSIVIHMLLKDEPDEMADHFGTLPRCMWSLLMHGALLDDVAEVLGLLVFRPELNVTGALCVFLAFIFIAALTIMNMVIAVLCNVISLLARHEKEEADISLMRRSILLQLKKFDDGDGLIDENELTDVMSDPESVMVLESLGIDVPFLQQLQVWTYEEPGVQIPVKGVIDQMLACRCGLPVTFKHMVMLQNLSSWQLFNNFKQHEELMDTRVSLLLEELALKLQNCGAKGASDAAHPPKIDL